MFDRTQAVRRDAQAIALAHRFGHQCDIVQVRQERALSLVIGVRHIVSHLTALAGQFADTRHYLKPLAKVCRKEGATNHRQQIRQARQSLDDALLCWAMAKTYAFPLMVRALALARGAAAAGEVPVGAVVIRNGEIIAEGANTPRSRNDPTAHAEIIAIRAAALALGDDRLTGCDLWVTMEPCAMCAGAIAHARIARIYYGADDAKGGAIINGPRLFSQATIHHRPEVYGGIMEREAGDLLRAFFTMRRHDAIDSSGHE